MCYPYPEEPLEADGFANRGIRTVSLSQSRSSWSTQLTTGP